MTTLATTLNGYGADIARFLEQYFELGGRAPLLAGTGVADQTVLSNESLLSKHLMGIVSAGPIVDENPSPTWQQFVRAYRGEFPDGLAWPSLFAYCYYTSTKAALLALHSVEGDLSAEQAAFRAALSCLEFERPTGLVKLNHNRQVTATIFLRVIAQHFNGMLYTKLIKTLTGVNQTLGLAEAEYLGIGQLTADNPECD
jgi:branched-chain amino acid transport system substrate-binding protein